MLEHNKHNSKKLKRKENRIKKLQALYEISSLNDQDRKVGVVKSGIKSASGKFPLKEPSHEKSKDIQEEPNPKRMKRDLLYPLNGVETRNDENDVLGKPDRNLLSKDQQSELKKLLKMRKKMRHDRPFLELTEVGEAASISLPDRDRVPLPFDDFQHFMITSLFAHMGTKGRSRWINCKKYQKLEHRIHLIIEGVGLKDYLEKKAELKYLSQFETKLEVLSPLQYGGDLISELSLVALTNSQKKKLASEYGSLKEAYSSGDIYKTFKTLFPITSKSETTTEEIEMVNNSANMPVSAMNKRPTEKFSREQLLLSPWEMIEENFPISVGKLGESYWDYVYTYAGKYSELTPNSPMWAVDCEMCRTTVGSELTRICIVNEDCNIVYETLVLPYNPIIDYVTEFSGITPSMLRNVNTRLEDVQADIQAICPPDLILVGHSLNNDLHAMKMIHPYVIDTSVIFNMSGIRHRKTKLKILVEEFLSLRIQTGDILGHSPIEDAIAAMKLVQAKLTHTLSWGNVVLSGPRSREESNAARILLESREAAGMARISVAESRKIIWPQLNENRNRGKHDASHRMQTTYHQHPQNLENVNATSLFSHLVRYDKNALLVAKKNNLDRFAPYYQNVSNRFQAEAADTNRAVVRSAREFERTDGTGIAYVSLSPQQPANAIQKADKLVGKFIRYSRPNTLYSVLLAGNPAYPGSGMMCLHLSRERIPIIPRFY